MVCRYHGGSAPQVKAKAAERLGALVDPAITTLAELVKSDKPEVALRAADSILDRNGYKGIERHQEIPFDAKQLNAANRLTDDELDLFIRLYEKATGSSSVPSSEGDSPPAQPKLN